MLKKVLSITIMATVGLTGCASMNNEDAGVLTGGMIGGLLGSQIGGGSGQVVAAGAGALLGAYLGGRIGKSMDAQDRMQMQRVLETSKTGQAVSWKNPDSGNQYVVKPTQTYFKHERPCRKFTTIAIMNGERQTIHGHACRDPKGRWQMQ